MSTALTAPRFGTHGRVLHVDLGERSHRVETVGEEIYKQFLGGYGLGAWLMWKHFPAGADPRAPQACFAICAGLLTGAKAPFSSRIQIVGKSPLTGSWADSNSGGSVASQLRACGYDALVVRGRADRPTVLVIRDDEVRFDDAGELWGQQVPESFDTLRKRYGDKRDVGVSAIGPAGERGALLASVMNDRYHAFGRQGFGAVYGAKNLKAIVIGGSGDLPVAREKEFKAICKRITDDYRRDVGLFTRFMAWMSKTKKWLGFMYRLFPRRRIKITSPTAAMRRVFSQRGTTMAAALSVENGDAPIMNWKGVGSRDFPLATSMKIDGAAVEKLVTKKLSCGDCPMPCKGIVAVKSRKLSDVRRPDYETLIGFGANLLNDDLELVTACHDACNRYGFDALSSSATLAWVCEAVERGDLDPARDLDGIDMRWGNGEAALALTIKMGEGDGCGAWLADGVAAASKRIGRGTEAYAVHVHGQEPAYHDPRFTSLMGVSYIADPTPGRHTTGGASWNETFGMGFALPGAASKAETTVKWKGTRGKGIAQAHHSNGHQVLNGLGLCMFTGVTGSLPWAELVNALTGWDLSDKDLLLCGERIQDLRSAFNWREGLKPADFAPHPRMMGQGDGNLPAGPLKGVTVPLLELRADYHAAMKWNPDSGKLSRARAAELGIDGLLEGHLEG